MSRLDSSKVPFQEVGKIFQTALKNWFEMFEVAGNKTFGTCLREAIDDIRRSDSGIQVKRIHYELVTDSNRQSGDEQQYSGKRPSIVYAWLHEKSMPKPEDLEIAARAIRRLNKQYPRSKFEELLNSGSYPQIDELLGELFPNLTTNDRFTKAPSNSVPSDELKKDESRHDKYSQDLVDHNRPVLETPHLASEPNNMLSQSGRIGTVYLGIIAVMGLMIGVLLWQNTIRWNTPVSPTLLPVSQNAETVSPSLSNPPTTEPTSLPTNPPEDRVDPTQGVSELDSANHLLEVCQAVESNTSSVFEPRYGFIQHTTDTVPAGIRNNRIRALTSAGNNMLQDLRS